MDGHGFEERGSRRVLVKALLWTPSIVSVNQASSALARFHLPRNGSFTCSGGEYLEQPGYQNASFVMIVSWSPRIFYMVVTSFK